MGRIHVEIRQYTTYEKGGYALLLKIDKVCNVIDRTLKYIVAVLTVTMVICITWQIICRFILEISNNWTEEIARYSSTTVIFLSAVVLLRAKAHIDIDILKTIVKNQKVMDIINLATSIIILIVLIPFIRWAFKYIVTLYYLGNSTTALEIPYWIITSTVFIGLVGCALYSLIDIIKYGLKAFKKKNSDYPSIEGISGRGV